MLHASDCPSSGDDLVDSVALKVIHVKKCGINMPLTVQGMCYVVCYGRGYLTLPPACHVLSHGNQC